MKRTCLLILVLLTTSALALACDITIALDKPSKKQLYKPGDEVVLLITVKQSHRRCTESMDKTAYEPTGLKILAATDWKETSAGTWERKMKLKVIGTADGHLMFNVSRSCSKEDSSSTIEMKCIPVR